jgi:tetraacyldisaccharide 4'-kinase
VIALFREWIYKKRILRPVELPACVVSVGNLTLGGTGKSPMVLWLADWAISQGISAGVLSRGYKRKIKGMRILLPESVLPPVEEIGDEPWMIRHRQPKLSLLVHKDRARMALRHWKEFGAPKLVLLDDGFQHWRAIRDFDIVMVDATESLDQKILPFGRMREGLAALGRADLLVITRASAVSPAEFERLKKRLTKSLLLRSHPVWKKRVSTYAPIVAVDYEFDGFFAAKSGEPLTAIDKNREFLLLSGIAKPEGFRASAKKLGLNVREEMYFPDHHALAQKEIQAIRKALAGLKNGAVLVNEKDWSRWRSLFREIEGVVLRVRFAVLDNEAELKNFLETVRQRCST